MNEDKLPDSFEFRVDLLAEYSKYNVPMLAHTVANIERGKFAGSEILVGMGGPMISVKMNGEFYGYVGFTYTTLAEAVLIPFSEHAKV